MKLTLRQRCVTIGFALLAACNEEGSLGEYPESSGTAVDDGVTDDSGTTDDSMSGNMSATESDSTEGDATVGDSTDTSVTDDSSDASSDTDNPVVCEQPGNCSEFSACEGASLCGTLDSVFDENGCVRQECQEDDACADDERCYRAMDFGGCAPSGVFCEDDPELQTCLCGSNPECGGGFCVPEDLYPMASALPGGVQFVTVTCGSLGDTDLYMQWGGLGACDLDERSFALMLHGSYKGMYEIDNSLAEIGWYSVSDGSEAEVLTATGVLMAYDGETVSGSVVATLAPNADGIQVIAGEFELPLCGEYPPCI